MEGCWDSILWSECDILEYTILEMEQYQMKKRLWREKGCSSKVWLKLTEGEKKGEEVHFYHNLP